MIRDFAVIENDVVINVIVVSEQNSSAFSQAIGKELFSTNEIPLAIGDYRRDGVWYRAVISVVDGVGVSEEIEVVTPANTVPLPEEPVVEP